MNRATAIRVALCLGFLALVAAILAWPGAGGADRAAPARKVSDPARIQELEHVVSSATAKGLIHRLDADTHRVEVDPALWARFDADTQRGFALSLAAYCDLKGSSPGRYVDLIDSRTARKIASYGAAGFERF
jgi:hypothetical protein